MTIYQTVKEITGNITEKCVMLFYKIPVRPKLDKNGNRKYNKKGEPMTEPIYPNPSDLLRPRGFRADGSVWIVPISRVPHDLILDMRNHECVAETLKFDESELQKIKNICLASMKEEIQRIQSSFSKTCAGAKKMLKEIDYLKDHPKFRKAKNNLYMAHRRAKEAIESAKVASIAFGVTQDLETLFDVATKMAEAETGLQMTKHLFTGEDTNTGRQKGITKKLFEFAEQADDDEEVDEDLEIIETLNVSEDVTEVVDDEPIEPEVVEEETEEEEAEEVDEEFEDYKKALEALGVKGK